LFGRVKFDFPRFLLTEVGVFFLMAYLEATRKHLCGSGATWSVRRCELK
jgi:hypothetical protein